MMRSVASLRPLWTRLRAEITARECLALGGAGALVHGVAQWSRPAAWIVGGLLALTVAVVPSLRRPGPHA